MSIFNRFAQLIRHDGRIGLLARLIYCDLAEMCTKEGNCIVSNNYFCQVFNVPEIDIVLALAELDNMRMIKFDNLAHTQSLKEPAILLDEKPKEKIIKGKTCRIIYLNKDTQEVFGIDKKDLYDMWN